MAQNTAEHGRSWHSMAQHGRAWHGTEHSRAWWITARQITARHSTADHSPPGPSRHACAAVRRGNGVARWAQQSVAWRGVTRPGPTWRSRTCAYCSFSGPDRRSTVHTSGPNLRGSDQRHRYRPPPPPPSQRCSCAGAQRGVGAAGRGWGRGETEARGAGMRFGVKPGSHAHPTCVGSGQGARSGFIAVRDTAPPGMGGRVAGRLGARTEIASAPKALPAIPPPPPPPHSPAGGWSRTVGMETGKHGLPG